MKKKTEFSKAITLLAIVVFSIYGMWSGIVYYLLCKMAIQNNTAMPDPTLAVTCVTTIIGVLVSYCLYQFGLKNSRNKYGLDENGQPYNLQQTIIENLDYIQDTVDNIVQENEEN